MVYGIISNLQPSKLKAAKLRLKKGPDTYLVLAFVQLEVVISDRNYFMSKTFNEPASFL